MRALLAAPLAAFGVWSAWRGEVAPGAREILDQAEALADAGFSLGQFGAVYPPAPVLIALVVGTIYGLTIVCSFLAGTALQLTWSRMRSREVPPSVQVALIGGMTLVPSAWLVASQDVATIGAITMLVIALAGFIRFSFDGDTSGGFTAGLFLAAAFLFGPVALVYAACLVAAAPAIARAQAPGEPAVVRATIAVLAFPLVALLLGWAFLEWRFAGSAFGFVVEDLRLGEIGSISLSVVTDSIGTVAFELIRAPVYLAVAALMILRRHVAGFGYLIPVVGLVAVHILFPYPEVAALLLLSFLAMASVPRNLRPSERMVLIAAAAVQLGVNIALPLAV